MSTLDDARSRPPWIDSPRRPEGVPPTTPCAPPPTRELSPDERFDFGRAYRLDFGKHKGLTIDEVGRTADGLRYLDWLLWNVCQNSRWKPLRTAIQGFLNYPTVAEAANAALQFRTEPREVAKSDEPRSPKSPGVRKALPKPRADAAPVQGKQKGARPGVVHPVLRDGGGPRLTLFRGDLEGPEHPDHHRGRPR